ncbi:CoA pyrophosphatase [Thioflexithrix psekupsensis]|uniref:CoA pyrophosphatase n=1 Tax=Thioflexithrix psekupsensis TaxID=1570016 RepID=A0A251X9X3_9GAMM|nr:CoA pyrophosphatase [Thioflexithrix psekupsensis]OUD15015.1 CoA pyrophosphatase [Thioflexithrix psekupsensis]
MLTRSFIRQLLPQTQPAPPVSFISPLSGQHLQRAAVLLPLVDRGDGFYLILTQRAAHLHHHPGQICLPGGRYDQHDHCLIETALRETEEEIGLSREFIEIAGYLNDYETITGFLITPVIGFVKTGFELRLDQFEVADLFEVPLHFVLNLHHYAQKQVELNQTIHHYYVLDYHGRMIWGATASILHDFAERLHWR